MFSAMDQAVVMTVNASAKSFTQEQGESIYDQLPAIEEPEFMFGDWSGGYLRVGVGQTFNEVLRAANWVGKRFRSEEDVQPVLVRNEFGDRVANEQWGGAKLRKVERRGCVSTAMVYDQMPIVDVFKKVTDDLVWGMMHSEDPSHPPNYLFYLERLKA